ncbi:hypothetical protein I311_05113 [Cryptococcus gattii NT-10]|nr:hypothetical protein I311_05113 [Cryptococcus gattii NT-10]
MNPASIIIAFLLILNLVKSFNCHLWRKLRERFTTLWNSHNSFTREERAIGAQAHSSINEGTQIKTEAPSKKSKENDSGTRPSSVDKKTARQSAKELAEDKVNRPRDPGQKVRERTKEPTEIDNHGRLSSINEAVNSIQKENPKRSESSLSSEQIRVLTVSEKAQESTATNDQVKNQSSKSRSKGKERAVDERPRDDKAKIVPIQTKMKGKAAPEESSSAHPSIVSTQPKFEENALMSGDYRPLKSALNKPTKKPKQTQNIHHNYLMTMRGFRPTLIPFPHGFYPKPHYPRNTMWWTNIPMASEHIMAAPKAPKEPKDDEVDKEEAKQQMETIGKESVARTDDGKDKMGKPTIESRGSDKASARSRKAEVESKAKKMTEIKTSRTGERTSATSIATINKDSASASVASKIPQDLVARNRQLVKATYVAQTMLCILLYQLYPKLSFLLLVFFVWQYIDSQQSKSLPILNDSRLSDRSTIKSPFASASKPTPSRTGAPSTTGNMAAESEHKVAEKSSKGTFRSPESQKGPENETGAEEKKMAELESLIKKLKSEKDLTRGLKDQLKRAFQAREEIAEDDRTTKKRLMRKLAEVESYLKKHHAQDKVSNGSEEKLSKVKAQREALKTEIANLQETECEAKPQRDERASNKEYLPKPTKTLEESKESGNSAIAGNSDALSAERLKMKDKIKAIELYIIKYRKLDILSDEHKEKVAKAEKQRRQVKEKLKGIERKMANVGSSGLSIEEKETIAKEAL